MQDERFELHTDGLIFAEGPRWHEGTLHVSDIADRKVLRIAKPNEPEVVAQLAKKGTELTN
jgi:sugar lactone lactonase YvrE